MNRKGLFASVVSSLAFAAFSYLAATVAPLSSVDVWAWRIMLTIPGILVALAVTGRMFWFTGEAKRVIQQPRKLLAYAFTAPMLAVQMWLFGWAPQSGYTLDLTLGYFLLPLVMVVLGRFLYGERLSFLSHVASGVAAVAVAWEIARVGSFSWVTALVCIGYPAYFVVRRYFETDGVGALVWEMSLSLPVVAWFFSTRANLALLGERPILVFILVTMSAISVIGTVLYVVAAKLLPYGIFGLLSYLEPALVTVVAVIIGERITGTQWGTYIGMWLAVAILGLDGVIAILRKRRSPLIAARPWRRRRRPIRRGRKPSSPVRYRDLDMGPSGTVGSK